MHSKNKLFLKITSLLLVIFLSFDNVAQVSAAFRSKEMSVDFERAISVSDPTDEDPPVEDLAEPVDEVVELAEEAPDAGLLAPDTGWYGDGSATEFYIGTVDELEGLDQLVTGGTTFAGKTIYLTADINLQGTSFAPIGTKDTNFNGTFNGQNHTISNLNRTLGSSGSHAGLFARIGNTGTENRAHFLNLNLTGFYLKAFNYVGGLAGQSVNALIDNVHVANSEFYGEQYVGGLIGYLNAEIKNSSATSITIDHAGYSWFLNPHYGHKMGGLGGYVIGGSLTAPKIFDNNTATNVSVSGARECGGLFGLVGAHVWVTNSTVTGSYIEARMPSELENRKPWAGGLVGWANGNYSVYAGPEVGNNTVISPMPECAGPIVGGPLENTRFWDVYNTNKYVGALTLAEAVAAADAGNNIKVISRQVNETAPTNIDKALTIVGPNVGISAIDGARVSEYRVYGGTTITVNASPVEIDGLSFEGTRFNLLTPTNLRNNIYKPATGDQYVIVVGSETSGGADPLTAAYDLSGNAFISNTDRRMIIHLPAEATDPQKTQMDGMFTELYPPIAVAMHLEGTADPYSYIAGIPPVAYDESYSTIGMAPLVVNAADGVLSNDIFENPVLMTASLVSTTTNGILDLAADGGFTYTPDPSFSGEDSFTYKALAQGMESNIATASIIVTQYTPPAMTMEDISGPYFVGEEREFQVTFTNPTENATTYANLSFSILADNMDPADIASILVESSLNPGVWNDLTLVMDGDKLKISFGPNVGMALGLGESFTLTYRVVFNTSKDYPFSATLYSHVDEAQYAITGSNGFMNVYLRPTFSSEDIAGPYMITHQKEFNLIVDNPYRGVAYNSLSASILINNITSTDIAGVELRNPANPEEWLTVTPVQVGTGLRLNLGPLTGMSIQPGGVLTLKLRITFNTPAVYPVNVGLFSHDQEPALTLGSFTSAMTVYNTPTLDTSQFEGPYFNGKAKDVTLTVHNPENGMPLNVMSANLLIQNLAASEIVIQVYVEGMGMSLTPEETPEGLLFKIPASNLLAAAPGESSSITINVKVSKAGVFPISGTVYHHGVGDPLPVVTFDKFMSVYDAPTMYLSDLNVQYLTGIEREARFRIWNPSTGGNFENISLEFKLDNTILADIGCLKVKRASDGEWVNVTRTQSGSSTKFTLDSTVLPVLVPGQNHYVYLRVVFNSPATRKATVYGKVIEPGQQISFPTNPTVSLKTVNGPALTSTTIAGPFYLGQQSSFALNVNNLNGGATFATWSAVIEIDDIIQTGFSNVEFKYPGETEWNALTPAFTPNAGEGKLVFTIPQTSTHPIQSDTNWAIDIRGYFTERGTYPVKVTLHSLDGSETVTIAKLADGSSIIVQNSAPVAKNDSYTTAEDNALNIAAPGVLSNDTDVDGDSLTAVLVTNVSNGSLTLNADGSFSYAPVADWNGTTTFTYKAYDGTVESNTATVTITVTPVNDAPVVQDIEVTTLEDTAVEITLNGTDIDGDTLTYTVVAGPTNGTVTIVNNIATYTPNANYNGTDSFTYKANDGELDSNVATVTITVTPVNDAPVAQDITAITAEDTAVDITLIGTDVDGDTLTYSIVGTPTNGTVTLAGNVATFTPTANFNGMGSFTYKVNDGALDSNTATVTITVTPVNDAPVAQDLTATTAEDTAVDITLIGTDVDGDTLTYAIVGDPTNGIVTLADNVATFTPTANFNGTGSFTYKVNDGELDSNIATVTITVTAVNDAPVAQDLTATTPEDTAVDINLIGTDVDGDTLTYAVVTGPANGTVTLAGNVATYTPNSNYNGADSFTYKVNDGELDSNIATVTITITPVNDAPVAEDIEVTTPEDTAIDITLIGTDVDGDTLTYAVVAGPTNGTVTITGNVATYTPTGDFSGTDSFTYKANDGEADSDPATVTITVYDLPTISSPDLAGPYFVGEPGTFSVTMTNPAGGTSYTSMSATIEIQNIGLDDFTSIEVQYPGTDNWITLNAVEQGDNVVINIPTTSAFATDPGESWTLNFRGTFKTAGNYPASGTLFCHDSGAPVAIGSLADTMVVNAASPVIGSADLSGPYFVGEQGSFTVTMTNPAGGASYTNLSATILIENITEADFTTIEVRYPGTDNWITLTPVDDGAGNLVIDIPPTAAFAITPDSTWSLDFRGTFLTSGHYDVTGTMYCHDSGEPIVIGSLSDTMDVYARPVISSTNLAGPYHVGALGSFSVTMTNPADGYTYTSMSAAIEIKNISLDDFTSIEVENPISGNWVTLSPVEQGDNVVINIPATSAFATGPGDSWTLNFRGAFKTAGSYDASGTLYCNDSGAPVEIGSLEDTMVVLDASPVISSTDLSGPYFVGEQGSFSVKMVNPADGGTYTNLSASIVIEGIGLGDFTSIEVKNPISGNWITLNAEQQGDNVVLNIGPTDAFAITPGKTWTLEFRSEFLTAGSYVASGTLYSHDGGEAIAIGSLTDTMQVYARPVISSDDVAGPYFVGEQREFHVTLDNTDGVAYTSLSASIFVDNIGLDDFDNIEVLRPGTTDQWITLTPVVEGDGLRLVVGPTSNYPVAAGGNITLTFRGTFNTAGNYTGTGTLFSHDGAEPVAIASLTATMNVYARPVISSDDVAGPYFVGEQREFHVTLDNTDGTTYTKLSAEIFVDTIGLDDFENVEVLRPGTTDQWITLTPVVEGTGLKLVVGPTENYPVAPNQSITLTFRGTFNTAGTYTGTGTLFSHDGAEPVAIASLTATMNVYARPVISSDDLAGPYFVGELQEFHVTLDNTDGTTYTSMSASIFVDNIGLADFETAEVKHPVTGDWIALTPEVEGDGLKLVIGPTSNYAVGPDDSVTLTFRVEFNTAGDYQATGTLFCHDSGTAVEIGSLTDTMVVYARPVISSDDVAGPYFVGEQQEFHVTLDNTDGTTYTSMSASIFVDNIGLADFETAEVKHPVTGDWIALTPEVEGDGLKLVIGPTSNYAVGPDDSVTLTFRVEFNAAGEYEATGTLYCHDSGTAVEIGSLTDTMVVYARPVISSDDLAGPYIVGELQEFHVTLDNTDGTTYTSMSASIFVDNIGLDDFETAEVKHPVTGQWITLTPVVEGDGLKLIVGPTSNYAVGPDDSVTLTFRVEFNTAGTYTGTGTLYCHDSGAPVEIGSLTDTMVVYARPIAVDDAYTTPEDSLLTVDAPGILANDTDPEGEDLSAIMVTDVSHGTLTLNADGSFTYMPDANWHGIDSFTYKANDGMLDGNIATVTITITAVNDAPVAQDIEVTTPEDTAIDITLIGTDVDGDALTYAIVDEPTNGSVTIVGNVATYTPDQDWHGTDTFTYKANDGELDSNVATVTITVTPVNDAPVAQDVEVTTTEDTAIDITLIGTDVDGDTLTYSIVDEPTNGSVTIVGNVVTYTPNANFNSTDSFTYKANDGELDSNVATVTITVTPVNDAPVAEDIEVTTPEDTAIDITLIGTDVDGDSLTYAIVDEPTNGSVTIVGNVATYTPNANFNGTDSFTYKANDGELDSNIATVTITITPVNDAPVAEDIEVTTPEDTAIDITLIGTDVDGDTLTYEIVDDPAHGIVTLVDDVATYTPDEDYNGTDSFTYRVYDGEAYSDLAVVDIIVTPVNDAPVAVDDEYTVAEDGVLTVAAPGVLENDYDVDGDVLNATLRSNVSHGVLVLLTDGSFTYTPDPDFFGTDSFTYTLVSHPQPDSGWTDWATVTITVTPVNDAPVLDEIPDFTIPELELFTFTALATDVDDIELTFSLTNPPAGAEIEAETGVFTWTPTHEQLGEHEITLCVSDGELEDCQIFTITVIPVNNAPIALGEEYLVNQDEMLVIAAPGVLENDSDPDNDTLTAVLVTTTQHGSLILSADGSFMYIPDEGYYGEDTFTYKAFDGENYSEEVTVTLIVVKTPIWNQYFPLILKQSS